MIAYYYHIITLAGKPLLDETSSRFLRHLRYGYINVALQVEPLQAVGFSFFRSKTYPW